MMECKERILSLGECLFRDRQMAHSTYMLISGKLRVEKTVPTETQNYWPLDHDEWGRKLVKSRVLFRIQEVVPYCFVGERECLEERAMPVQVVADEDNTRLLIIPRKIMTAGRYFNHREQEKLLIMSTVNFPDQ